MNERIVELARQAGLKKHPCEDREYIGDFDWREFADLIVEECVKVINTQYLDVDENSDESDWIDATWNSCLNHTKGKILKHFN